jgi:hypothetical protein
MAYQPKSYRKFLAGTITAAVVASAVAPAASAAEVKFPDLAGLDQETTAAIEALVGLGVIVGQPDGKFAPNKTINRGQAAEMIVKALPNVEPKANPTGKVFEDLTEKSYSSKFAEALVDAKLIPAGGKFGAGTGMTREAMAVTLVAAFGLTDTGAAVEVKDLDKAAEASRAAIKILAQHGLTKLLDGNFNPTADVTRSQFALFFYRAVQAVTVVAPEVTEIKSVNETTLQVKVKGDLKEVKASDFTFDNGLTVSAAKIVTAPAAAADTFTTVELTTSKQEAGKTYKLVTFLGKEVKTEVKVEAPAAAAVTGVSATNLKEVTVAFSNVVSKADLKTTDFAVKNNTVAAVTLSEDKKTAVLTLTTEVAQQSDVEVTAKKSVKFENGLALAEDVVKTVNITDVTIPVAESITLTGPNTFEVKFSEPVKAVSSEVLINNGIYGVAERTLSTDGRTLTVKLSASSLTEGSYQVKVSGYSDFANFAAMSKTFTLEYKKDVTVPTVKLVSASQSEVVVEFDKAVTQKGGAALSKDFFYHTYSAWKPVAVETTDNKKFTLKFSDTELATQDFILPEGNVTVTVLKSVSDVTVVDMWGNAVASDTKLVATVSADKVAPTVTKVEAKAEDQVVVTFSEKIDIATAKFAIKNSEGKAVSQTIATPVAFDNDKLTATLNLSSKLAGGTYTVEVSDAVDTSLSKNKITAVTLPFTVTDKTPIDLASVTAKVVTNDAAKEQYIYVTYPEAVATSGANSALIKDNYLVGGAALASGDKVEVFGTDNKRVKITVKYRGEIPAAVVTANTTELTMGRIADAAGNVNAALSTNKLITPDTAPTTFKAKAVGLNKLVLEFAAELKTVTADGITVDGSDVDTTKTTVAAIDKVEVISGKTYVTVTVKAEEKLANKSTTELNKMSVAIEDGKLETITGQKLTSVTPVAATAVTDAIAPELESVDPVTLARTSDTVAVITLDFDEDLAALHTLAATDLVLTDANGKVYVAGTDYEVALNGSDASKLEITFTTADKATLDKLNGTKFSVATKTTVHYLDDAAENVIKAFEAKQTKTALTVTP